MWGRECILVNSSLSDTAIAAGYSKLGEMQKGTAHDAEAEQLQQLEEELKKMEDGLHDVEEYLDGRARQHWLFADWMQQGRPRGCTRLGGWVCRGCRGSSVAGGASSGGMGQQKSWSAAVQVGRQLGACGERWPRKRPP